MLSKKFFFFLPVVFFCIMPLAFGDSTIKILVTGFEPFGGFETNPSQELVHFIQNRGEKGFPECSIQAITLPVTYFESWAVLKKTLDEFQPDIIISFGYAPGSKSIRLETTALNADRGHADNKGIAHKGKIIPEGQAKYETLLPIARLEEALTKRKIPVSVSDDAGGYLCNHIFYHILHYANQKPGIKAGFIHVPSWKLNGKPGLADALEVILRTLTKVEEKLGMVAEEMVHPLQDHPFAKENKASAILVEHVKNQSSQHIDTQTIRDGLISGLLKIGVCKVILPAIEDSQPAPACDFVLSSTILSQETREANSKITSYLITLKLINARSSLLEWIEQKETTKVTEIGNADTRIRPDISNRRWIFEAKEVIEPLKAILLSRKQGCHIVMLEDFRNLTLKHLNFHPIQNTLCLELMKTGKCKILEKESASQSATSEEGKNIESEESKNKGVDFILGGTIKEQIEIKGDKPFKIAYTLSVNLLHADSGAVEWQNEREILLYDDF